MCRDLHAHVELNQSKIHEKKTFANVLIFPIEIDIFAMARSAIVSHLHPFIVVHRHAFRPADVIGCVIGCRRRRRHHPITHPITSETMFAAPVRSKFGPRRKDLLASARSKHMLLEQNYRQS